MHSLAGAALELRKLGNAASKKGDTEGKRVYNVHLRKRV
jgi:hypothetical protein